MCCGPTCLKKISFYFIGIFLLVGLTEILFSAYYLYYLSLIVKHMTIGEQNLSIPPLIMLLCGIALVSLLILGCISLSKEIRCCVYLYSAIMLALATIHITNATFVKCFNTDTDLERVIGIDLNDTMRSYPNTTDNLNNIHSLMQCCGVTSPNDWSYIDSIIPSSNSTISTSNSTIVTSIFPLPGSCCGNRTACDLQEPTLYQDGCQQKLVQFIGSHGGIIAYCSLTFGLMEVLAAVFGIVWGHIDSKYETSYKI